jgi:hypothetical protein
MSTPQLTSKSRLHGISIFLSASVPTPERSNEYERIPEAPLQIEEAVMCVARAIFMEGGTLVFGAHPSISPLVARVIDHYYLPAPAEELPRDSERENQPIRWKNPSLVIYQSNVWKQYWAEATERLTRHPLVRVEWTEVVDGETVDLAVKDRPQAPKSMEKMRVTMLKETFPVAMIAIGGMKGVLDEAKLFAKHRQGKPIFTLATTGGAAALLPQQQDLDCVRVMDTEAMELVRQFWKHQEEAETRQRFGEPDSRQLYVPYAFVAQQIVSEIVKNCS